MTTPRKNKMVCAFRRCHKSEVGGRAYTGGDKLYCSPSCGDAARHSRAYKRRKEGIHLVACKTCRGTGRVEKQRQSKKETPDPAP